MSTEEKIEEREIITTSPKGEYEHHEKIIEDKEAVRRQNINRFVQFIWLMFGLLEVLLGLRFFLKLIAANPASPFARLVYDITNLFMWPFAHLTRSPSAGGMVVEIPTIFAMVVYILLAWVLVSLVGIIFSRTNSRHVSVYERRRE